MSHHAAHTHKHVHIKHLVEHFAFPFHVLKEFVRFFKKIIFALQIITLTVMASMAFFFEFEIVQKVFGIAMSFLVKYVLGQYLTLLPHEIVILLTFVPKKFAMPILLIAMISSFFMVFLI